MAHMPDSQMVPMPDSQPEPAAAPAAADTAEILRAITRIAYLITRARRHDRVASYLRFMQAKSVPAPALLSGDGYTGGNRAAATRRSSASSTL